MKHFIITMVIVANAVCLLYVGANYNYQTALRDASRTDGTDSSIEEAMSKHGFNKDWSYDYSFTDKLVALWNLL